MLVLTVRERSGDPNYSPKSILSILFILLLERFLLIHP